MKSQITKSLIHAVLALTVLVSVSVQAQDWSQWRGPNRDGAVVSAVLPAVWPASVTPVWRVEVGEGYSSPVVASGRVFVHSRRDPEEVITAVDLESGKVVWQQKYPAPFAKNQYAVRMAKGPNSTPIVAGDQVFTLGVTGVLSAWRVADGTLAWRKDYSSVVDTSQLFCGTAMSPMLEGGSLIVQVGSDVHGGRVMAIDPATGAERWTWKGPGPGYASPIAITTGGVRQIVTLTDQSIVGIDARTGGGLWSVAFPDEWHENIVTPVWTGTLLIVSGVRQGTQAFTIENASGTWKASNAWKNPEVTMYMSAPVFADGTLYGISNKRKGQLVALNAATGALRWATEGREGDHASILLSSSHVMVLTNAGELIVAKRDPARFAEERRIEVAKAETWAVPAFVQGGLVVRDAQGLARLAWGSDQPLRLAVPDGEIAYDTEGSGPTVVFLHGAFMDRRSWDRQLAPFARRFRVVRYDIRPFGESSRPDKAYSVPGDLLRLLDHLNVDRAHLVGHSFGGASAIDFALLHPDRVSSLVLAAAAPNGFAGPEDERKAARAVFAAVKKGDDAIVEAWLDHPIWAVSRTKPDLLNELDAMTRRNLSPFRMTFAPYLPITPPAIERLGDVRAPTLVLVGDRDTAGNREAAALLAKRIPGATMQIIAGADHALPLGWADEFNALVIGFISAARR